MLRIEGRVTTVQASKDLVRVLDRLGPKYVKGFLKLVGNMARKSVRKSFAVGGRPPWAPLAATTLERRRYGRGRLGFRPGRAAGMRPLGGAGGTFARAVSVRLTRHDNVWIGPPAELRELLRIHARGSWRLPAREVFYFQDEDTARVDVMLAEFVDRALRMIPRGGSGRISAFLGGGVG